MGEKKADVVRINFRCTGWFSNFMKQVARADQTPEELAKGGETNLSDWLRRLVLERARALDIPVPPGITSQSEQPEAARRRGRPKKNK